MPVVALDGAADRRRPPGPGGGSAAGRAQATLRRSDRQGPARRHGARNGVLVHGPTCLGVRGPHGRRRAEGRRAAQAATGVAGRRTRSCAARRGWPRRSRCCRRSSARCPRRELPFERPRVLGVDARQRGRAAAAAPLDAAPGRARAARRPALARARRRSRCAAASSPPTTAPSTSRSAATSTASTRPKEHERCGSHLVGPMLLTTRCRQPRRGACAAAAAHGRRSSRPRVGAVAASTEIFGWMTRHPAIALARALAKPGHELQHRLGTREPTRGAARGRRGGAARRAWSSKQ